MKNMLTYKGYYGSISYSEEDEIFYGKLEFIDALVSFEATDAKGLKKNFQEAVDDYLDFCKKEKKTPKEPFRGSFNIRTGSHLHRSIALLAKEKGITLNKFIKQILEQYIESNTSLHSP